MKHKFNSYSSYYKISKRKVKIFSFAAITGGIAYIGFKKYDLIKKIFCVNPFHDTIFSEEVTSVGTDLLDEIIKEKKKEIVLITKENSQIEDFSFPEWFNKDGLQVVKDVLIGKGKSDEEIEKTSTLIAKDEEFKLKCYETFTDKINIEHTDMLLILAEDPEVKRIVIELCNKINQHSTKNEDISINKTEKLLSIINKI